jgi:heme-degrading monooxygenase HmoA
MDKHDVIYAVGIWSVRPGNENAFVEAWMNFASWTLRMKGSRYGNLLQDLRNPSRFVSYGAWEDMESARAWRQQPEFNKSFDRFLELCDEITPGTFHLVAETARKGTG